MAPELQVWLSRQKETREMETVLAAYKSMDVSSSRSCQPKAAYMREHRKKERALIRKAKAAESIG
jgi:hypothetical protein